jgi:hypothetical protein
LAIAKKLRSGLEIGTNIPEEEEAMEFTYNLRRDPEAILEKVCALAQDKVIVSGNGSNGWFTGAFEGTYRVKGNDASIKITRKPIFVSWSLVNEGLKYLVV